MARYQQCMLERRSGPGKKFCLVWVLARYACVGNLLEIKNLKTDTWEKFKVVGLRDKFKVK